MVVRGTALSPLESALLPQIRRATEAQLGDGVLSHRGKERLGRDSEGLGNPIRNNGTLCRHFC